MTFITFPSFNLTAIFLDKQRLGKQRLEARTILDILMGLSKSKSWSQHPITKSWRYFILNGDDKLNEKYIEYSIRALKYYINCMLRGFVRKGCKNSYDVWPIICDDCLSVHEPCTNAYKLYRCSQCKRYFKLYLPWWTYWKPYINSNIASLLRKNPVYYQKHVKRMKFDDTYLQYGYIWPISININNVKIPKSMASPIMLENQNAVYCKAIIQTGKRAGDKCGNIVRTTSTTLEKDSLLCGVHRTKYAEKICTQLTGKGLPCGKKFKSSYPYCGIHMRKQLTNDSHPIQKSLGVRSLFESQIL